MYMLAMMFAVIGAYFIRQDSLLANLLGLFCLVCTLGLYQPMVQVAFFILTSLALLDFLKNKSFRDQKLFFIRAFVCILLAGGLYYGIYKSLLFLLNIEKSTAYNSVSFQVNNLSSLLTGIHAAYSTVLLYIRSIPYIGNAFYVRVHYVYFCILLVALLYGCKKENIQRRNLFYALIVAILLPLGSSIVLVFKPNEVHDLTYYANCLYYLLAYVIVLPSIKSKTVLRRLYFVLFSYIMFGWYAYAQQVYQYRILSYRTSLHIASQVIENVRLYPQYQAGKTRVLFVGHDYAKNRWWYERICQVRGVGLQAFYSFDNGYYPDFVTYCLNENMNVIFPTRQVIEEFETNPEVKRMPIYPAEGCMKMINGVLVVKVGPIEK